MVAVVVVMTRKKNLPKSKWLEEMRGGVKVENETKI